jgi:dTDP-D-glucose 4,6-dehydratase
LFLSQETKYKSKDRGWTYWSPRGADLDLITYVTERLGHDARYVIDSIKLQKELGREPSLQFEEGKKKSSGTSRMKNG